MKITKVKEIKPNLAPLVNTEFKIVGADSRKKSVWLAQFT